MPATLRHRLAYERDRIGFLRECQHRYGDVFRFSDTATVVLDPGLVHELFVRTNNEFGIEGHLLGPPPSRVDTTGRMSARKRARRALSHSAFGGYESHVVDLLRQTLARTEGREVDVRQVMTAFTGRSLTDYCLGSDGAGLADALADAVAASEVFMGSSLTVPAWLPTPSVRRLHRADARLRRLLADRIDARRAAPARAEAADLLDVLLTDSPDAREVTTMVEAILRASYGQPGVTLTWAVLTLARLPGLAQRLTTDSGDYAEAFVKELLRMYPPTWLMGREVWEHTTVGDIEVGPGEQIMFCAYLVHRDPRWWHDPETFDPGRWLTPAAPHTRYAYFPFGAGPRICPGNHVGLRQLTLAVRTLAREYDITVVDPRAPMVAGALLVPKGLRARFIARASESSRAVD
ncbi:cytochrome P450 [Nocardia wallacei]|uniref:cytochrome P450 n=1 Tax=Nocardia wallacei TaxID=480035 RepID=UPI002454A85A|nr:cytochrome P450 [Nocardia wallacei]